MRTLCQKLIEENLQSICSFLECWKRRKKLLILFLTTFFNTMILFHMFFIFTIYIWSQWVIYCCSFRYHMFGANVYHLSINITYDQYTEKTVFQKEGNYGNNWNYGQILLNETSNFKVCQILILNRILSHVSLTFVVAICGLWFQHLHQQK